MTSPKRRQGHGRILLAASLGNALEWYDFTIYVLFAVQIGRNFFPDGSETAGLLKAFLTFGVGFVVRPVGALLIGRYADRAGRKAALTLTIGLMALGTLMLALAPTYAVIGIGAPLIILAGRVLQGFSAGGEIGGAAAFLVEHAPPGRKGLYAACLQASMAASNILGALVALAIASVLTHEQVGDWGWRVPFLLGLVIAPVGLWLRGTLEETPDFLAADARGATKPAPLGAVFAGQQGALVRGFGLSILWAVSVYVLVIYMPVYVQQTLHFRPEQAFAAALVGNVCLVLACFASGMLADRLGRRRVLAGAAFAILVLVIPLLHLLQAAPTTATLIAVQTGFCILVGLYSGAAPAALADLFPAPIRSTGMSVTYNAAVTLFGGFAPAILTALSATPIALQAPAFYVALAAVCGLAATATWGAKVSPAFSP